MHRYRAHELSIESEIRLSILPSLSAHSKEPPDVKVLRGIAEAVIEPKARGVRWQAKNGEFSFKVDRVARYRASQGRQILVEGEPGIPDGELEIFLLGTTMAALLMQRKRVVLHAGAVATGRGALVVCGTSGAGKSTLLAALASSGYPLLADDLISLELIDKSVLAYSAQPGLRLCPDAARDLEISYDRGCPVRKDVEKYCVLREAFQAGNWPVFAVVFLSQSNSSNLQLRTLSKSEGLQKLLENSYRNRFPIPLGVAGALFPCLAHMCHHLKLVELTRPMLNCEPFALRDLLLNHELC